MLDLLVTILYILFYVLATVVTMISTMGVLIALVYCCNNY